MSYRVYNVKILASDYDKAESILKKHDAHGDIDKMSKEYDVLKIDGENVKIASYWISPYLYEDFESIVNEFIQAGIRVL